MRRLAAALLAVLGLTAFAPAPLPRPARRGGEIAAISLETCQGTWRIVREEEVRVGGWGEKRLTSRFIRIHGGEWVSLNSNKEEAPGYTIRIDGSTTPARIGWYSSNRNAGATEPTWAGLVRRHEGQLQVSYMSPRQVPGNFGALPAGAVVLTLRRED